MDWFSASTEHTEDIARVLAALSAFGEEAQISLAPDGMLISATDTAASAGASLFFDRATFGDYRPLDVPRALAVNLDALVKVVCVFGGWQDKGSCSIMYTMGQPLEFRSSIDQMLAQASVNVVECGDKEVPGIDPQQIIAHAILSGAAMRQLFRHCERARAQDIEIVASSDDNVLELQTHGTLLSSRFALSDRDSGTLQYLDLPQLGHFRHRYDFKLFARAKTAISRANKASIRVDANGVLSLQTMHGMGKEQVICDMAFLCNEPETADI